MAVVFFIVVVIIIIGSQQGQTLYLANNQNCVLPGASSIIALNITCDQKPVQNTGAFPLACPCYQQFELNFTVSSPRHLYLSFNSTQVLNANLSCWHGDSLYNCTGSFSTNSTSLDRTYQLTNDTYTLKFTNYGNAPANLEWTGYVKA